VPSVLSLTLTPKEVNRKREKKKKKNAWSSIFVEEPNGKRLLGIPRCRRVYNIKMGV
jgi:hypothetical protein